MPTLAQEDKIDDKIAPRSILRHRPIGANAAPGSQSSITSGAPIPVVQRASRARPHPEEIDDGVSEQHPGDQENTSTGRASHPVRRTTTASKVLPRMPRPRQTVAKETLRFKVHPLLYLGMGMLAMLVLWTLLTFALNWFNTTMDDIHYGRPRTFQMDAVVSHNDSAASPSHFIAINLNRHIEIIEFPGGDASHARIYIGPQLYGDGADLTPVTLSFVDVNGDHKPDMVVHFQGSRIVFINDQGGFRPPRPDEQPQIEQFLQHLGQ
jgi:hypothetical protein